jgi:hypothetical protein
MKVLVGIVGLLLGLLSGVTLLLSNPLALVGRLAPLPADVAPPKAYRFEDYRGIQTGTDDLLGLGDQGNGMAFRDPALAYLRIGTAVLPAGNGRPAALAVKVSTIAGQNSLWRARLGTLDHWDIFWPGEGSVFASGYSNYWALARDLFLAALRGGGPEVLEASYPLSALPPAGITVGVMGGAGRYAGFTGEIREALAPSAGGTEWTLAVEARPPPLRGQ